MFWTVALVVVLLIAFSMDSTIGKIIVGSAVVAIGALLLNWITGMSVLITVAKVCAAIIVVAIVWAILSWIAE